MDFLKNLGRNFSKGVENAKKDVAGEKNPGDYSYAHISNIINDETILDEQVIIDFKKFMNKALDAKEIEEASRLLIQKRPKVLEILDSIKS